MYRTYKKFSRTLSMGIMFALALFIVPVAVMAQDGPGAISWTTTSKTFDNGIGFKWGAVGDSFVIQRSKDKGKTWSPLKLDDALVHSIDASSDTAENDTSIYVHFADSNHGWIVWSSDSLHVTSTADSGATWRTVLNVDTDAAIDTEIFPGPGRAVILGETHEGMNHASMLVLATDDNGVTWTDTEPSGDGFSGWAFRNATNGFLSINEPPVTSIILLATSDGGKSWNDVDVPLPPQIPEDSIDGVSTGTPSFSGSNNLIGQLPVSLYLDAGTKDLMYKSTDGGKTWSVSTK